MQNAAGGGAPVPSDSQSDRQRAVVSDLTSLIEHVRASIALIETTIAGEQPLGNQEIAANVILLDDVTPRYVRASTALNTCNASLAAALHFLGASAASEHGSDGPAGSTRPSARAVRRA